MPQEVGDLIDVMTHSFRGSLCIVPLQRSDDRFVPLHRSTRTSLLLQGQLARLHEQIVERRHDADDDAVAGRAGKDSMKRRVFDDGQLTRFELATLRVENPLEVDEILLGDPGGRHAGHGGLEHPPHVQQLIFEVVAIREDGREWRHEPIDVEFLWKRALPMPADEQPDRLEHAQRIPDRATTHAEPLGKLSLSGQRLPRRERRIENEHTNTVGNLFRNARLSDRLDLARIAGAAR